MIAANKVTQRRLNFFTIDPAIWPPTLHLVVHSSSSPVHTEEGDSMVTEAVLVNFHFGCVEELFIY